MDRALSPTSSENITHTHQLHVSHVMVISVISLWLSLTSGAAEDAGGARGRVKHRHGVRVAQLKSVALLHRVVTRQDGELHLLR